ncbi:MAG: class I SAM-dependent methyltransferase [Verrucomicrobiales bacterium]|nr:MAG: class I SAM-dependent methyltransferase [Verrucomicrobiaceae bacterium]
MEAEDWKGIAANYEGNILSVYDNDEDSKIESVIKELEVKKETAVDLGCGTGKFLPLLSKHFKKVQGCDYSEEMIEMAKKSHQHLENLNLDVCDLRASAPKIKPSDVALCINVILSPSISDREKIWLNVRKSVQTGGHLVLVAPSLESALYSKYRLVEWNIRNGDASSRALSGGFETKDEEGKIISRGGIIDCGGVPTKHYLEEELVCLAHRFGFKIKSAEKITYPWSTEFSNPPKWMKSPFPWDWLFLLEKQSVRNR